jgi:hypothetical protein
VHQRFYGGTHPHPRKLMRCQSDYDDYACSHGEVVVLGSDGMGPNT